jgi:hypothetical protein
MRALLPAAGAAFLALFAAPAFAADYYVAAHYTSANGDGEAALLVSGGSIHPSDLGYTVADIAAVNSGGTAMSVYTAQFNCAAGTWRVTSQYDYYVAQQMAPVSHETRDLPAFAPVGAGTPADGARKLVCGWPASQGGAAKFTADTPTALSNLVSPTLRFTPPPDNDRR